MPDNRVVLIQAGVYAVVVALTALEADWSGCVFRAVEIGGMGNHRGDEVGHFSSRTFLWPNAAFCVEIVANINDVHGAVPYLSVACICARLKVI